MADPEYLYLGLGLTSLALAIPALVLWAQSLFQEVIFASKARQWLLFLSGLGCLGDAVYLLLMFHGVYMTLPLEEALRQIPFCINFTLNTYVVEVVLKLLAITSTPFSLELRSYQRRVHILFILLNMLVYSSSTALVVYDVVSIDNKSLVTGDKSPVKVLNVVFYLLTSLILCITGCRLPGAANEWRHTALLSPPLTGASASPFFTETGHTDGASTRSLRRSTSYTSLLLRRVKQVWVISIIATFSFIIRGIILALIVFDAIPDREEVGSYVFAIYYVVGKFFPALSLVWILRYSYAASFDRMTPAPHRRHRGREDLDSSPEGSLTPGLSQMSQPFLDHLNSPFGDREHFDRLHGHGAEFYTNTGLDSPSDNLLDDGSSAYLQYHTQTGIAQGHHPIVSQRSQ